MTDFQKGALWALELFNAQLDARYERYRRESESGVDGDIRGVLNATANVVYGIKTEIEGEFVRKLGDAEKEEQ